ncbi:MAG: carbamoyltransferase HypF [Marmoricola sp.]
MSGDSTDLERRHVRVEGIVQGVGFRPFVFGLAERLGVAGWVGNDAQGVFIEAEAHPSALARFVACLASEAPPLAVVERVHAEPLPPTGDPGFTIVRSGVAGERQALVSPDTATCADCLRDMADPDDRRYGYAFTNCTNCGPRFTIVRDVPYDRPSTTMAGFALCPDCAKEYDDPADRRFHAQPVCCPRCGPSLRLVDAAGGAVSGDPLEQAARLLREGEVLAVKGLGGYHLAADAGSEPAVAALRSRKHREDKPFALMAGTVADVRRLCRLSPEDEAVLTSPRRPIVLLLRRADAPLAGSVAPGNRQLGVMLPYTPMHHLLARAVGSPFVLTSGNVSDEPIVFEDAEATERLAGIADHHLIHDRPIHIRTDDSVCRVFGGREMLLRRSRGYAPQPVPLPSPVPRPVLGCGAELKNTFCLAKGARAFVSHHIGDLENYETLRSFTGGIDHFRRLFGIEPDVVAHDLHPEYLSTKYAFDLDGVELVGVQHHHAHIASCLADNGQAGPVIGVAFDGTGYGSDGTIWGGELLVASLADFERVGFIDPVPLPGGAAAIREPWRMAAAHLRAAYGDGIPALDVRRRHEDRWSDVLAVAEAGLNSPPTSSAGRLFDGVAAILGVRDAVNYEGQAAVELEQLADSTERSSYPMGVGEESPYRLHAADLVRAVVEDLRAGVSRPVVAARFHNGLADAVVTVCAQVREQTGLEQVALSGGVFQNLLLLQAVVDRLTDRGFRPLLHSRVPPNDGGISLGQVAVAGARDRAPG